MVLFVQGRHYIKPGFNCETMYTTVRNKKRTASLLQYR